MINSYKIAVVELQVRRTFGKRNCKQKDIEVVLKEMGFEVVNYINLIQHSVQWQAFAELGTNLLAS
jgi:hypothetical protein